MYYEERMDAASEFLIPVDDVVCQGGQAPKSMRSIEQKRLVLNQRCRGRVSGPSMCHVKWRSRRHT